MIPYVENPLAPVRRRTREVRVGDVGVGGANPIRVQSMTTTNTLDTTATVDQIERMVDAGCEIARVTAPGQKEARNLEAIAAELRQRGIRAPLVADIHFAPNAAMIAAEFVEKVRINPGNYADKKKFEVREYDDAQYAAEIERVAERFRPLVHRCKQLGRALRIGTNHGSLSDRILNRYGDTPRGMVESALEFLDVCEDEGFGDVIFSMKASNTQVAIQAYRLLCAHLYQRNPDGPSYPLHLGVTEAGDGEDGRIKSAIGIGALLEDGLGDTIRVSLTEDPVKEVPVARALASRYDARWAEGANASVRAADFVADPYAHERRRTRAVGAIGGDNDVRVELDLGDLGGGAPDAERLASELAGSGLDCEGLHLDGDATALREALARWSVGAPLNARRVVRVSGDVSDGALAEAAGGDAPVEWCIGGDDVETQTARAGAAGAPQALYSIDPTSPRPVHATRRMLVALDGADAPLVLRARLDGDGDDEAELCRVATDLGALLCDGIGDAVVLAGFAHAARALDTGYRILQGARLRTSWTEFISCPSCGRTLFDLEETTARIKRHTEHLSGVKIAIMGCIVNGPGEMADADFGYVGSGPDRVNLFVGHDLVERNVPTEQADDRLVELIKKHGRWQEP